MTLMSPAGRIQVLFPPHCLLADLTSYGYLIHWKAFVQKLFSVYTLKLHMTTSNQNRVQCALRINTSPFHSPEYDSTVQSSVKVVASSKKLYVLLDQLELCEKFQSSACTMLHKWLCWRLIRGCCESPMSDKSWILCQGCKRQRSML